MLFFSIQQELDCINDSACVVGKIKFDVAKNQHVFQPDSESLVLSSEEKASIEERLAGLDSGKYSIPMQDDD